MDGVAPVSLIRRPGQGVPDAVVRVVIAARVTPMQSLDVAVGIDVIGTALMAVVTDPALVAEVA